MSRGGRAAAAEVRVRAGGIVQWARDEHPDRVVAKGIECWIHGCVCKRQEAKGYKGTLRRCVEASIRTHRTN